MTHRTGTADYSTQPGAVYVDVPHGIAFLPGGVTDDLANITTVIGSAFNDTILDAGANGHLSGGDGNDTISGGQGNNIIDGGNGNDTVDYSNPQFFSFITVNLATGVATHDLNQTDTLTNIENVTGANTGTTIIGDANDNILKGSQLSGAGGNNTLIGLSGISTADYSAAPGGINVNLASGTAAQNGYGGHDVLSNIQAVTGSASDDIILGDGNNNTLSGGLGHDVLAGLGGDDTLIGGDGAANELYGGTGNDTYVITTAGDTIVEAAGEGSDTVQTSMAFYTLPANVENLTYIGTGNFSGTGNELNNLLTGGTGNDTLNGGDGNDQLFGGPGNNTLIGGNGTDTVDYSHDAAQWNSLSGVTINLATGIVTNTSGGTDTLIGIEQAVGTNTADTLVGDTNSNYLIGLGGDDTLDGGTGGANTLQGGTGNDTYIVRAVGDTVLEFANEGYDTVQATVSSFTLPSNVEKLVFTGTGNFTGLGNSDANVIIGGSGADYLVGFGGDDTLIGGGGAPDTLQGGTGNDIYAVESVGDTIVEFANEGFDQVQTTLTSFTLSANVEELIYIGSRNFTGVGNSGDNVIIGGSGNDSLTGGAGNDTLTGGAGNDTFFFTKGDGLDAITDFKGGGSPDIVDLTGYGVSNFSQLQPFMSQSGADTVIAFDAQNHITLSNIPMVSLTAADFLFH